MYYGNKACWLICLFIFKLSIATQTIVRSTFPSACDKTNHRPRQCGELHKRYSLMVLSDKLKLNDNKTEFLIIGTSQQMAKVDISQYTSGRLGYFPRFCRTRNLGSWFDSKLTMETHITKTYSSSFYYLYNITSIRKYLFKHCTETLIHAFITSPIDYCNRLLYMAYRTVRLTNSSACKTLVLD